MREIKRVDAGAEARVAAQIERALLADLAGINEQSENASVVLAAHGEDGALIGGATGSTSYGWLLVKTLWVAPSHRGTGLGRALMEEMEAAGRAHGCHAAWLDTSNGQAKAFYERLGYAVFGRLENAAGQTPEGHCRWFMKREL
jgi:ribosomal protein S18 acetylase RimI-like enzyme